MKSAANGSLLLNLQPLRIDRAFFYALPNICLTYVRKRFE